MKHDVESIDNSPADPREVSRANFLRTGSLPHFKKGQEVWVADGESWAVAVIERRLPGNVYAARFVGKPRGRDFTIVAAGVCGGVFE